MTVTSLVNGGARTQISHVCVTVAVLPSSEHWFQFSHLTHLFLHSLGWTAIPHRAWGSSPLVIDFDHWRYCVPLGGSLLSPCLSPDLSQGCNMYLDLNGMSSQVKSVLVCAAAITKYHRLGGLYTIEIHFSQFWMLGGPRSRRWRIPCLVGPSAGLQSSLCPHKLSVTLGKAPNPFTRAPPPWPHLMLITFQRPHLLIPLQCGAGFNMWILRGLRHSGCNTVPTSPWTGPRFPFSSCACPCISPASVRLVPLSHPSHGPLIKRFKHSHDTKRVCASSSNFFIFWSILFSINSIFWKF